MPYLNTGTRQYIKKCDSFNSLLTLSDNSQWKVSSFDKSTMILWLAMDDVIVGDGFLNMHKITHVKRRETIEAEIIQK